MTIRNLRKIILIGAVLILAIGLAGCGGKSEKSTVATDGSTSMESVIMSLSESFMEENEDIEVTYNPTGSGTGITAVKEGRCDIGLSSRGLKDEEKAAGLVEKEVARDGIAIVVSEDNPVKELTVSQVADIFTGKVKNWKDVGGKDEEIVVIGREAGSGTRDGFESTTGTSEKCVYRQELTSTGDVIATVSKNTQAIGYASLSSVKGKVRAVKIEGVAPSEESVQNGSYKIQRPFMLITKKDKKLSEAAQKFYDYALSSDVAEIVRAAGAIPMK